MAPRPDGGLRGGGARGARSDEPAVAGAGGGASRSAAAGSCGGAGAGGPRAGARAGERQPAADSRGSAPRPLSRPSGRDDRSDTMSEGGLTHLDEAGAPRMVDVGDKEVTRRIAVATGFIRMQPPTLRAILSGETP